MNKSVQLLNSKKLFKRVESALRCNLHQTIFGIKIALTIQTIIELLLLQIKSIVVKYYDYMEIPAYYANVSIASWLCCAFVKTRICAD